MVAASAVFSLVASMGVAAPELDAVAARVAAGPEGEGEWDSVTMLAPVPAVVEEEQHAQDYEVPRVVWPEAGRAQVELPVQGQARAGKTVVSVGAAADGAQAGRRAAGQVAGVVDVEVLAGDEARALGGVGVAVRVSRPEAGDRSAGAGSVDGVEQTAAPGLGEGEAAGGDRAALTDGPSGKALAEPAAEESAVGDPVDVVVDVSGFSGAFGGNFADRLRLGLVPECVTEAADAGAELAQECTEKVEVLETSRDVDAGTLSAQVDLSSEAGAMLVVMSTSGGSAGTYAASPVTVAGSWNVGIGSGSFEYSYPLPSGPTVVGQAPEVMLSYSSSSVDGLTTGDNAQVPGTGIGWGLNEAFVEAQFASCGAPGVTGDPSLRDLCYQGEHYRIVLNGKASVLVRDTSIAPSGNLLGVFRLRDDPGWRVERRSASTALNGDNEKEYWRVFTNDGTRYDFGRSFGQTTASPTNSVWTVPVFGDDSGDPCYTGSMATGWCNQGWRWNLDMVYDTNENISFYYYTADTNTYQMLGYKQASYHRGGYLTRIESGIHYSSAYTETQSQVLFDWAYRCTNRTDGTVASMSASCPAPSASNAALYPDVPVDLICSSGCTEDGPTFFNTKMLRDVTSQRLSGTTWRSVDRVSMGYQFPTNSDGTSPHLWLSRLERNGWGTNGANVVAPPVTFGSILKANRVDYSTALGVPPLNKRRVSSIRDELGAKVTVTYGHPRSSQDCSVSMPTTNFDRNTKDCFPRFWSPESATPGFGLFHKYVVTKVVVENTTSQGLTGVADAPVQTTTYNYVGGAGWAQDNVSTQLASMATQSYSDWRGYQQVEVEHWSDADYRGQAEPVRLAKTQYRVHRGLHGKKFTDNTTLSESVEGFNGGSSVDHPYLAGRVREERSLRSNLSQEWGGTITTYTKARTVQAGSSADAFDDAALVVPSVVTRRVTDLVSGTMSTVNEVHRYTYDSYGRVLTDSREGGAPDMCTRITYAGDASDLAENLLTYPAKVQQETLSCTSTSSAKEQISDVRYWYDGNPTSPLTGQPIDDANLTRTRVSTDASSYIDTLTGYDTHGRVTSETDGKGQTTTTAYSPIDADVQTITVTNPLSQQSVTTLSVRRLSPVSVQDANGNVTTMVSDGFGRLLSVKRPGEATPGLTYTYNVDPNRALTPNVQTTSVIPGGGTQSSWTYLDSLGQERQTHAPRADNASGALVTASRYDELGRLEAISEPIVTTNTPGSGMLGLALTSSSLQETRHTYNTASAPTKSAYLSAGTQQWATSFSNTGLTTTTTPPAGGVKSVVTSDVMGRVVSRTEGTGSTTATVTYDYDVLNNLRSITDADGHQSTFVHDWAGRRTSASDPDTGTTTTVYDKNSNPTIVTSQAGRTLTTTYDVLNRPVSVTGRPNPVATAQVMTEHTYDTAPGGIGLPASSTTYSATGQAFTTTTQGYTNRGLPTGSVYTTPAIAGHPAASYTTTTTYGAADEPLSTTMPAAGDLPAETLTYGYNSKGLPTTMAGLETYVSATTYHAIGAAHKRTIGTTERGLLASNTYTMATRRLAKASTATLDATVSTPVQADSYTFDSAGNLTQVTDTLQTTPVSTCHTYDPLGRLTHSWTTEATACSDSDTAAAGPAGYNTRWAYNTGGDITSITRAGTTTTNTYATTGHPHAMTTAGTTSYTYDADGNTTTATDPTGTTTYEWDAAGKLTTASASTGDTTFVHATDGTRLARTTPDGTTTLYIGGQEIDLKAGDTTGTRRYYTHNGHTVAIRTETGLTWQTSDRQGSTQLQLAPGATTPARIYTDPYGQLRPGSDTAATDRSWLGKTADPTTGLTHLGHRYYNPTTGRFLTPDPLNNQATTQSPNPYAYANNNPNTYTDKNGLAATLRLIDGMYGYQKPPPPKPKPIRNPVTTTTNHIDDASIYGAPKTKAPMTGGYARGWKPALYVPAAVKAAAAEPQKKGFWRSAGDVVYDWTIKDAVDCVKNPTFGGCAWGIATTVFKPAKVVDKAYDGVNAARKASKAAKTADNVLPIGPGSEKAWTVLNRVDAKGAPLPGYKGGRVFENTQGRLPETPGVTYKEWDVNPYVKGVNRGPERIVTGSDGSAYWTGDHYDTFLMFRGPTQ